MTNYSVYACVSCDIDQFSCSSSSTAFKTINTKQRPLQNIQALLFIIHARCSPGIPWKFSHHNNRDVKF